MTDLLDLPPEELKRRIWCSIRREAEEEAVEVAAADAKLEPGHSFSAFKASTTPVVR